MCINHTRDYINGASVRLLRIVIFPSNIISIYLILSSIFLGEHYVCG